MEKIYVATVEDTTTETRFCLVYDPCTGYLYGVLEDADPEDIAYIGSDHQQEDGTHPATLEELAAMVIDMYSYYPWNITDLITW